MSKYADIPWEECPAAYINVLVAKEMKKPMSTMCRIFSEGSETYLEGEIAYDPVNTWMDAWDIFDQLLVITGAVTLKQDGSATAEINGKQETATGGHCRAICILYLMAKDSENQLQKA
ncbi:hypothetical protein PQD17_gp59 [Pantoea phage PdC23]|uniref:Uncharacterized protein n=1 Tax=Pantoea phage PdC23 TaxID=2894356 RepID=A0AAE8YHK0_9CAUD|nr:hypothetical protein PQD17_gp59 [Pantoea phage PdC23]UGC97772.1 hypothetical protein pdc_059 [Pantoea phage PdC23]